MGLADVFSAEDRVAVKFSDFYELVKGCTEREVITNGLKYRIPHAHILAMLDEHTEPKRDPVRCADCAKTEVHNGELFCLYSQDVTPANGFCHKAERKEGLGDGND